MIALGNEIVVSIIPKPYTFSDARVSDVNILVFGKMWNNVKGIQTTRKQ